MKERFSYYCETNNYPAGILVVYCDNIPSLGFVADTYLPLRRTLGGTGSMSGNQVMLLQE